ncbi:hypothetical protein ACEPAF_405 [Sanghuangporus sanghuang]
MIRAIIAAFIPEDREALLKELSQVKKSSFNDVNVRVVPAELKELVDTTKEASTSVMKKEEVDLAKVTNMLKSFQVMLDALSKGSIPHRSGVECSETPRNPVLKYIQAGKCIRSPDGRIVLLNGGLITRSLLGNNLKEQIDSFHAKALATHTVGMVDHNKVDQDKQENYNIECLEILINEAKKKAADGQRMKSDGMEISRFQPYKKAQCELLSIALDIRKQMKELTMAKRYNVAEVKYGEVVDDPLTLQVGRFASEQSEMGETLSTEEILALSGQGIAAEASMPLRTVSTLIEDTVEVECVLDQGAVVCLLHKDVWEKLQIPLSPDKGMILETADAARSSTIGMISNAKFMIAEIDVLLQVQVVPNAPFQALLGRPFFTIMECETKDYTSGDQHITLTDLNDHRKQSKVATGIQMIVRGPLPKGFLQVSRN